MRNPDRAGMLHSEAELAMMAQPTLQLSTVHPVTRKLVQLSDSNPALAELVLRQLYHAAMASAGRNDDAVAIANRVNELVEQFLAQLDA